MLTCVFCRLISDLVVVIVSAAIGGIIFSCLGQPVCVFYGFAIFLYFVHLFQTQGVTHGCYGRLLLAIF